MPDTKLLEAAPEELDFTIFRSDLTIKPEIKKAFLRTIKITEEDIINGYISLEDGTEWILYANPDLRRAVLESLWPVKAICSFQVYEWGNAVVCRLYKDMKGAV
jgi:hypothetical protein